MVTYHEYLRETRKRERENWRDVQNHLQNQEQSLIIQRDNLLHQLAEIGQLKQEIESAQQDFSKFRNAEEKRLQQAKSLLQAMERDIFAQKSQQERHLKAIEQGIRQEEQQKFIDRMKEMVEKQTALKSNH